MELSKSGWVAVGALWLAGCGGAGVPADAERTSKFRQVEVEKGISAQVLIAGGHAYKTSEGGQVDAEVMDDRLVLRRRGDLPAQVTVYAEEVTSLSLSGQSELVMDEVTGEQLEIRMSGQSQLRLAGQIGELRAHLTGQAELQALELEAARVKLDASGNALCWVTAQEAIQATLSGNARCEVTGNPEQEDVQTSGNASLLFR